MVLLVPFPLVSYSPEAGQHAARTVISQPVPLQQLPTEQEKCTEDTTSLQKSHRHNQGSSGPQEKVKAGAAATPRTPQQGCPEPWQGTNCPLSPRELGAEGCQSRAQMGSTPLGSLLQEERLPPALAPMPRAGQPAPGTPTSLARHSMAQASVGTGPGSERCPSCLHCRCALRGACDTATSICGCWVTRSQGLSKHGKDDPSLTKLLGFALFHSCYSSSGSLPPSSLLQGARQSNQVTSLQRSTVTRC